MRSELSAVERLSPGNRHESRGKLLGRAARVGVGVGSEGRSHAGDLRRIRGRSAFEIRGDGQQWLRCEFTPVAESSPLWLRVHPCG
eukprot:1194366-Prorocentrum_minimum.AAC.6